MVNDKRIGDPAKLINLHEENSAYAPHIRIEVEVNGMEKFIPMQRNAFEEGAALEELRTIIRGHLPDVYGYALDRVANTKANDIGDKVDLAIKQVHEMYDMIKLPELGKMFMISYRDGITINFQGRQLECYFVNLHTGSAFMSLVRDVDLRMRSVATFAKLNQYRN